MRQCIVIVYLRDHAKHNQSSSAYENICPHASSEAMFDYIIYIILCKRKNRECIH